MLHFWDYHGKPAAPYGDVGFLTHWFESRPANVELIGVVVDARLADDETQPAVVRDVTRIVRDWKLNYSVVLDSTRALDELGNPTSVGGLLPLTLVVAADGTVVDYRSGRSRSSDLPELRQAVAKARRK